MKNLSSLESHRRDSPLRATAATAVAHGGESPTAVGEEKMLYMYVPMPPAYRGKSNVMESSQVLDRIDSLIDELLNTGDVLVVAGVDAHGGEGVGTRRIPHGVGASDMGREQRPQMWKAQEGPVPARRAREGLIQEPEYLPADRISTSSCQNSHFSEPMASVRRSGAMRCVWAIRLRPAHLWLCPSLSQTARMESDRRRSQR